MTFRGSGSVVWVGMILVGLALGAYVYTSWPGSEAIQTTPAARSQPVRATASADAYPELVVGGVAGAVYPGELFVDELGPAPFLDAVIAAPPILDAG